MTRAAQLTLKRLIDRTSDSATFILACNTLSKVEEPVQARCVHFAFAGVPSALIAQEIRRVAVAEHLLLDETGVAAIVRITGGDVRRGLNALQTCADAASSSSPASSSCSSFSSAPTPAPSSAEVHRIPGKCNGRSHQDQDQDQCRSAGLRCASCVMCQTAKRPRSWLLCKKSASRNITRGCNAIWRSRLPRFSLRDAQYSSTANSKRHTKAHLLYVGQVWPGYVSGHQLRATGVPPPPVPQKSTINLHTNTHA